MSIAASIFLIIPIIKYIRIFSESVSPSIFNSSVQLLDNLKTSDNVEDFEEYLDSQSKIYSKIQLNPSDSERKKINKINADNKRDEDFKGPPIPMPKYRKPQNVTHDQSKITKLMYICLKTKFGTRNKRTDAMDQILHDFLQRKYEKRAEEFRDIRRLDFMNSSPIAIELFYIPNDIELKAIAVRDSFEAVERRFWATRPSNWERFLKAVLPNDLWYARQRPAQAGSC